MEKFDYLVVGSGLYGSIFAHEVKAHGKSVLVVDKRPNIAGNIYTENIEGINVHKYGAHIFHTNNKQVWNYITQFAEFNRFTNSPVANYKGELYSLPFNMYGLKVIYDAAHAFAVKYKGESSACFGDASMFSFHATKVFNTIEGGCVCFKDDSWIQLLNDMKNFGIHGPESVQFVGANAKMNEFQAAMGICNLKHLDEEIEKRKHVVEHYRSRLEGVEGIKLSIIQKDVESNYAYFPVVFDGYKYTRNEIFEKLVEVGIGARKYFYPLTNSFECYRNYPTAGAEKTPIAQHIALRVLTLPLYADLSLKDVDRICDVILG